MENVKGTRDFFPPAMRFRRWLEGRWRSVAEGYGYEEVDAPVLEPLELYTEKSGEEIVRQLYRLRDLGDRELALRPEMTPSLARMLLARGASLPRPIRWYSIPRLFRFEKPQRGRLREFFQLNMDLFGVVEESADAELICAAADVLRVCGLADEEFRIDVNDRRLVEAVLESEEIPPVQRPAVLAAVDRLEREGDDGEATRQLARAGLSPARANRLLHLFKLEAGELAAAFARGSAVAAAYAPLERLGPLVAAGGAAPVVRTNPRVVRGIAYYTGIVFEIFAVGKGLRAICGGGRYDDLLSGMGGPAMPAVGFGMGDAVLEELLGELSRLPELSRRLDLYVVPAREEDLTDALALARRWREDGLVVETALRRQPVGKQIGRAAAAGARFVVVVGEAERASGRLRVRDLARAEEVESRVDELPALVRGRLAASARPEA